MADPLIYLSYAGHPRVQKNSKQIVCSGGKRRLITNTRARAAKERAILVMRQQARGLKGLPFEGPLHLLATFSCPCTAFQLPDLSNLYELPQDALEAAGVIVNDQQIASHDGSRRVALCEACKQREPGRKSCGACRSDQCPYAITELSLWRFGEDD